MTPLDILYRGPLDHCNYDCWYCPFGKNPSDTDNLNRDRASLRRFLDWLATLQVRRPVRVLFTPWGEAMFHPHYQEALVEVSHMPGVLAVGIQTNGTGSIEFLDDAERSKLSLWLSFHPTETPLADFLARCRTLRSRSVPYSVGMVAHPDHLELLEPLRDGIPADRYVWLNAYKSEGPPDYTEEQLERLRSIDPWFDQNLVDHPSHNLACDAGYTSFTIDGEGDIRRCHFVADVIGNIADPEFESSLESRPCPNASCGCFIGYVNLPHLGIGQSLGVLRNPSLRHIG